MSFRDVVAGDVGASATGDVLEGNTHALSELQGSRPNIPLESRAGIMVNSETASGSVGKENVGPVKSKRKYTRKPKGNIDGKDVGDRLMTASVGGEVNCNVVAPSAPRQKRKYTRKAQTSKNTNNAAPQTEISDQGERQLAPRGAAAGRGRGRGRGKKRHGDGGGPSSGEEADVPVPADPRGFTPPTLRVPTNSTCRVSVLLRNLLWGGEVLSISCPTAVGTVLDEEETEEGALLLRVDFGAHLGVQLLPRAVCCAIHPPEGQ